ncbi:SpoIIE family protein phosphatase [Streptomyces sp. NPDC057950]|uniref:SpoIIE family protein phosphatase n=1 Tax=Streptomyces sp. NPDC057950 TaxID=3346288 RepID=UPI0036ED53A9
MGNPSEASSAHRLPDAAGGGTTAGFVLDGHGVVSAWSASAEKLFGRSATDVIGQSAAVLWPEAFTEYAGSAQVSPSGRPTVIDLPGRCPVEVAFRTTQLLGSGGSFDEGSLVIASPVSLSAGSEGQAILEALFTQAPIGIAVYDRNLHFVRVNAALERIHGLPAEQTLGRPIGDVLPGLDAKAIEWRLKRVLETREPIINAVHHGRTPAEPDREHVWDVSSVVLTGPDGNVLGVTDLIIDITDRHQTRERLALLGEAAVRVGTTLDVQRTAGELVDILVPRLADVATTDLLDSVVDGAEPGPMGASPVSLLCLARKAADTVGIGDAPPPGELQNYPPDSPHVRCLADGRPRLIPGLGPDTEWLRDSSDPRNRGMREYGDGSSILVPLRARDTTLGLVHLYRARHAEPFEPGDLVLAQDIVARAAVCLDNARRYTNEHRAALTLHASMLPRSVADQSAVEVAHHYQPSRVHAGVSGDWFDVIPLSGARVALVVGAVPGTGFQAAACMGHICSAVRTLAQLDLAPDELLGQIDDMVPRLLEREHASGSGPAPVVEALMGSTCLYAVYDPVSRRCVMASAGHPSPAIVGRDGAVSFPDLPTNRPLGLGDPVFEPLEVELAEGSTVVLCSQDVLRQANKPDALTARLSTVIAGHSRPLDVTCRAIADLIAPHLTVEGGLAVLLARTHSLNSEKVATWTVPPVPAAVGDMRSLVLRQLDQWDLEGLAFTTELIVSELITNAIRYGHDPIQLRLVLDRTLICEVSDTASTAPHIRRAASTDEGGRGLFLVAQCSHRWGTRHALAGKTIWAEQILDPVGSGEVAARTAVS